RALKICFSDQQLLASPAELAPPIPGTEVVFADPPWYESEAMTFLWLASSSLIMGGHLLLSFPGILTRPNVEIQRVALLDFAESCGLNLMEHQRGALAYVSPPFELASLETLGFEGFPADWRRGDLLVFEKVSEKSTARPPVLLQPHWEEITYHGVRIRFKRQPFTAGASPSIRRVYDSGFVRPTVSARDPYLPKIDIWTSGNVACACDDASSILKGLRARMTNSSGKLTKRRSERREQELELELDRFEDILQLDRTFQPGSGITRRPGYTA
ncbi:MAG TPA: hypothetical protein VME66_05710, partial [Candidatus Acidoferrales bacterium]|nr:hypothetical protein [Candidatus Acidoferrales bacterium]